MYQEMIQLARASYQNMIHADVGVRKTKPGLAGASSGDVVPLPRQHPDEVAPLLV
jgi:hypothetical protein